MFIVRHPRLLTSFNRLTNSTSMHSEEITILYYCYLFKWSAACQSCILQLEVPYSVPKTISMDQNVPSLARMATPWVALTAGSARKIWLLRWVSGREMRQNVNVCKIGLELVSEPTLSWTCLSNHHHNTMFYRLLRVAKIISKAYTNTILTTFW